MRTYITILLILTTALCGAQDFKALVREMRDDYMKSTSLQVVMEIAVYDSASSARPHYVQKVDIRKEGDNYWYQMGDHEMLLNASYMVVLNKEARQISYSKRSLAAESELKKAFQFSPDSILSLYNEPVFKGKEGDAAHYMVKEKNGAIAEVHFYIVPETRRLKQIAYRYREGQYASIRFLAFDKAARFDAGTFSENRYMVKADNRMVPARVYTQYELNAQ